MSDEQNTKTKDDVGTGTEDNLTIGQELGEFVRSGVGKALEAAEDLGGGIKDFMSNEEGTGMLDSLFDNATDDARNDQLARNAYRYIDYFNHPFEAMRYPQELFSQSQPNAVAFYIMTRKNSIASQADTRGTSNKSYKFSSNDSRRQVDLRDPEFSTEQNRSSATIETQKDLLQGAGTLAALGAGLAFASGKKMNLVNGALTTTAAAAAGFVTSSAISDMGSDNSLQFLNTAIHLHVPQSVISQYQANWSSEELGIAGALTNRRVNQTSAAEIVELAGRGIIAGAADIPRAAGLGNASVGGAVEASSRKVNNPFKEQLFKSIGFRKFAFSYVFSPMNEFELDQMEQIIKHFKYHMHPEISPGQQFLVYPSEFLIQFLHCDPGTGEIQQNTHLPRISQCALTDMKVTYGPDGSFQTLKDTLGGVSEVTMELSFTELETLTANRITAGY
jgi:hypothetical protein